MANNDIETESLLDPSFNHLNSPARSPRVGAENINGGPSGNQNQIPGKEEEEEKRTEKEDKPQAQSARVLGE